METRKDVNGIKLLNLRNAPGCRYIDSNIPNLSKNAVRYLTTSKYYDQPELYKYW